MQEVQLYIEGERVELFKDEIISLTQTIQNVKDIKKVFTDFTRQFNLPASREVNKIFKHYYNYDIADGFDARFKADAAIKINGADFRKGKLRLNSVELKNGKPYSYKVVFFGETVTLVDILGEDELSELDLSNYDHEYSLNNVTVGLQNGLSWNGSTLVQETLGDIIYPLMSHTNRFIYDSSGVGTALPDTTNIYTDGAGTHGINYTELKPALKLNRIIDAIETKYGLTFSTNFFGTDQFDELYLLLHREAGGVYAGLDEVSQKITLSEWVYSSGDNNLTNPLVAEWVDLNYNTTWTLDVTITPDVGSTTGVYGVRFRDRETDTILQDTGGLTGTNLVTFNMVSDPLNTYLSYDVEVSVYTTDSTNFSAFTPTMVATYIVQELVTVTQTQGNYVTSPALQSVVSEIQTTQQIPKMKVIDFLTSIFQTFNLTAYVEDDIIVVRTLDDYFSVGTEFDLTPYVDIEKSEVDRSLLYRYLSFKYSDPQTFLIIQKNERDNDEFGDLEYTGTDNFDGGKYSIETGFEHLLYERLYDVDTEDLTPFQWGWLADEKQDPTSTEPIIFYAVNQDVNTANFDFNLIGVSNSLDVYNRPSNVIDDSTQTINFGAEVDEWTGSTNENSLFGVYYGGYVANLFNIKTRILKVKGFMPLRILLQFELNDTIIVKDKKYTINSITTNMQTGEFNAELINKYTLSNIGNVFNYDLNFNL